jgi:DNA-binding Lrp family transcriptional regulator
VTGNKLENEILGVFSSNIYAMLSINQISKKLNRAYPYINSKVNELIEDGILDKIQIGHSYQCSINFSNEKAVALLTLNDVEKKNETLHKLKSHNRLLEDLLSIRKEFKIITILLKGKSLFFILDYLHDQEAIKNLYPGLKEYDLVFYDKKSFQQYLLHNKSKIYDFSVLYSHEKYFEILGEIKDQMIFKNLK